MQIEEKSLAKCSERSYNRLASIFKCISGKSLEDAMEALDLRLECIVSAGHEDVYAVRRATHSLFNAVRDRVGRDRLVAVGVHVARNTPRKILVMLGLLSIVEKLGVKDNYVIVSSEGEKHFLYGKDVYEDNILGYSVSKQCNIPVIVLNAKNVPIGWGKLAKTSRGMRVTNLIDLGWYLRSGV